MKTKTDVLGQLIADDPYREVPIIKPITKSLTVPTGATKRIVRKRRKKRGRTALSPLRAEARRKTRDLNRFLSEEISVELGFAVKVTVLRKDPVEHSPAEKRVLKAGVRKTAKAYYASLYNSPL